MTMTLDHLDSLADQVPSINQKAAESAKAASGLQIGQQALQGRAHGATAKQIATGLAPQITQTAGAADLQARQADQQQLAGIGQAELQRQQTQSSASLREREMLQRERIAEESSRLRLAVSREEMASRKQITEWDLRAAEQLQSLGYEVDHKLQFLTLQQREQLSALGNASNLAMLDDRLAFNRDELGRKFTNSRQLADHAAVTAKSQQEFAQKMEYMEMISQRKISMMKMALKAQQQILRQGYLHEGQKLDLEQRERIQKAQAQLKAQIRKEQANAKNKVMRNQAIGSILGAGIGAAAGSIIPGFGTAAGAAAGSAIGGGLGTLIK